MQSSLCLDDRKTMIKTPVSLIGTQDFNMRLPKYESSMLPLCHIVDVTALVATSASTKLPIKYLETYLIALERWLWVWRIAIDVDNNAALLFSPLWKCIPNPCGLRFLGGEIQWVRTARYLRVTLDRGLTWKSHIDQVKQKASQRLGVLSPLLNQRSTLSIGNNVLLYKQLIQPMMAYASPVWRNVAQLTSSCSR